jgi:hypothetical protein
MSPGMPASDESHSRRKAPSVGVRAGVCAGAGALGGLNVAIVGPEPHLAAAGALASATRANAEQIAELTLASVARADATFASGHRITPPFRPLLAAQTLARRAAGAEDAEPLFLAPDTSRPATPRHVRSRLERIGRETGLRFDATTGWNRYITPPWATFHQLAAAALIAR